MRAREYVFEYLKSNPCVDCGCSDVRTLEFDHVRGEKKFSVSSMRHHSLEAIIEEIGKCEVRCANCHSIATGRRAKVWWTKISEFASEDEVDNQGPHKA